MAKCANCASEAFFTYAITKTYGIDYCSRHVPKFLQAQKNAGMLPLRLIEEPVVEPTPTAPKTSKKKVAVVEPVVEEAPTE